MTLIILPIMEQSRYGVGSKYCWLVNNKKDAFKSFVCGFRRSYMQCDTFSSALEQYGSDVLPRTADDLWVSARINHRSAKWSPSHRGLPHSDTRTTSKWQWKMEEVHWLLWNTTRSTYTGGRSVGRSVGPSVSQSINQYSCNKSRQTQLKTLKTLTMYTA